MKMKLVYHSNFDIFTLKGVAAAVFISLYALVLTVYPALDPITALALSSIASVLLWKIMTMLITRRHGVCVEFKYSKQGSGRSRMDLWYGIKKLGSVEVDLSSREIRNADHQLALYRKLMNKHLGLLRQSNQVHYVGCTYDDAKLLHNKIEELVG